MQFARFLQGRLQKYRRRKSIGLFLTRLGPTLARLFGKAEHDVLFCQGETRCGVE